LERLDIQVFNLLEAPSNNTFFSVENQVTLSTINKAKGNEMGMVYVLGVDSIFWKKDFIKDRNKLFTAITRSKGWVSITGLNQAGLCKNEMLKLRSKDYKLDFIQPSKKDTKTILRGMTEQQSFLNDVSKRIESFAKNSGFSQEEILQILANQTKGKK
jgi:superfamily I DNA and RNA helicase